MTGVSANSGRSSLPASFIHSKGYSFIQGGIYLLIAAAVPVKGFFRIRTRAKDPEPLFVTLLAFAGTGAGADNGGNRKTLFNTLKNN